MIRKRKKLIFGFGGLLLLLTLTSCQGTSGSFPCEGEPLGLSVGYSGEIFPGVSNTKSVREILGDPTIERAESFHYPNSSSEEGDLSIYFEDGIVNVILFAPYEGDTLRETVDEYGCPDRIFLSRRVEEVAETKYSATHLLYYSAGVMFTFGAPPLEDQSRLQTASYTIGGDGGSLFDLFGFLTDSSRSSPIQWQEIFIDQMNR